MSGAHRYAYLHGFASSPRAWKGVQLRERLAARGVDVELPDLNAPSFAKLSMQAMLDRLDALDAGGDPRATWRFVGSSMGGWLTARWAELHPERVDRVVLLCPAFDMRERWATVAPAGSIDRWRADREIEIADAEGRMVPVHFRLYEEASEHPGMPHVLCPATVIHGTRDERVPIESSRRWVARQRELGRDATLIEVDDGHDLHASIDVIERAVIERLAS